ncbi:MAG: phosphonopyruvate decarboxylase [Rhodospirillales bacterium]
MIVADTFLKPARESGFDFFAGVPCSFLTSIINRVISGPEFDYVGAASEGEAVAIASGAWLAGHKTVVMCQNSGLGNAVNPLTSLNFPFRIPTMMIVTWRGGPGLKDEPQHELMGRITPELLDVIRVPHRSFPTSDNEVIPMIEEADAEMAKTDLPFAFIMEKGSVADETLEAEPLALPEPGEAVGAFGKGAPPTRVQALERMLAFIPDTAAVVATTGFTGRELYALDDRKQHLYQVGSMGCAAPMGLGIALNADRPVVVIDGDGAALMKLGGMATIGAYRPKNLIHVVMDNSAYESTGGQPTVSPSVDFADAAIACGYAKAFRCDTLDGFEATMKRALGEPGPHLMHMRITPGTLDSLPRPSITPPEVARRFRDFLTRAA